LETVLGKLKLAREVNARVLHTNLLDPLHGIVPCAAAALLQAHQLTCFLTREHARLARERGGTQNFLLARQQNRAGPGDAARVWANGPTCRSEGQAQRRPWKQAPRQKAFVSPNGASCIIDLAQAPS
jgi:hypothetical protein